MAIQLTTVNVRLNTGISWWAPTTDQKNHIKSTYDDTGKRTEVSAAGESGLTKTKVVTYADRATKDAWDADSTVAQMVVERRAYTQTNKITHVMTEVVI